MPATEPYKGDWDLGTVGDIEWIGPIWQSNPCYTEPGEPESTPVSLFC